MIARLKGEVVERGPGRLVVDAHGVGYEVFAPSRVVEAARDEVILSIYTAVREDAITLYGFDSAEEKATFEQLIGVSGIGPKLALACLSGLTVEALARAINGNDLRSLSAISGIGKKTAERIVLELKGKVVSGPAGAAAPVAAPPKKDDGLSLALAQLGYKRSEIEAALAHLEELGKVEAPLAERIQLSLKRLSRG